MGKQVAPRTPALQSPSSQELSRSKPTLQRQVLCVREQQVVAGGAAGRRLTDLPQRQVVKASHRQVLAPIIDQNVRETSRQAVTKGRQAVSVFQRQAVIKVWS